jgi:hypothetical protein
MVDEIKGNEAADLEAKQGTLDDIESDTQPLASSMAV